MSVLGSRGARALAALAVLGACAPPGGDPAARRDKDAGGRGCTKVGQSCEVAPGKLGTCVVRDDCAPPLDCFVCQSQH